MGTPANTDIDILPTETRLLPGETRLGLFAVRLEEVSFMDFKLLRSLIPRADYIRNK